MMISDSGLLFWATRYIACGQEHVRIIVLSVRLQLKLVYDGEICEYHVPVVAVCLPHD